LEIFQKRRRPQKKGDEIDDFKGGGNGTSVSMTTTTTTLNRTTTTTMTRRRRNILHRGTSSTSRHPQTSKSSSSKGEKSSSWVKEKTTLVFDLDGVLYPASNGYLENVRDNQRKFLTEKFNLSLEDARRVRKEAFEKHNQTLKGLRSLGYAVEHDEFTEYVRKGYDEYLSCDLRVNKTLERLKLACSKRKGKMVLMTNTAEKQARKCLGALNIDEKLFEDGIYGSSFMGDNAKPMPEAFEMVCEDIGVSPKECVMFEDSFKNLKTCVALGMGGVFVAGETLEMELGGGGEKNKDKSDKGELNAVANVVVESIGDLFEVCPELFD
jgi:putative hydrolase of the HAD superfamily